MKLNGCRRWAVALVMAAMWFRCGLAWAQASNVSVRINTSEPGHAIADDFAGLSYEVATVNPNDKGVYYFREDNRPLVQMFKTLGIRSLRIGGNTADRATVKFPDEKAIDNLFAFAKAADVKVIFTMRLKGGDPETSAKLAKYIMDHYRDQVDCFAIGNEPNAINSFTSDYHVFVDAFRKYSDAILAAAPEAKFCGPSATGGATTWTRDFAGEPFSPQRVSFVTYHYYPGGNAAQVADPAAARAKILAPQILQGYQKIADVFVPTVLAKGAKYRLEEVNSFYNGGRKDASDTQAAALWSIEFLYWWAGHGCSGMNFHTGDYVAREAENSKCNYAAFWSTDNGYEAHPLAYGIKAFNLAGNGKLVPVEISSNPDKLNVAAFGVLAANGDLYITLLNKSFGSDGRTVSMTIDGATSNARVQTMSLGAPKNDIAATSGITLGGAEIREDGTWIGQWSSPISGSAGRFVVELGPASATIVRLARPG